MIGKHSINRILSTIDIKNTSCRLNTYLNTFQPEKENFSNTMSPKKGVFIKKSVYFNLPVFKKYLADTDQWTDRPKDQPTYYQTNKQTKPLIQLLFATKNLIICYVFYGTPTSFSFIASCLSLIIIIQHIKHWS